MGRELRDKRPQVEFNKQQATEAYWQQQLKERDARAKLRQKEYADKTRTAKYSNIKAGDKVLLKQTRENKLSPNYEPDPCVVTHKDGNVVVLQDANGNNKMRNIAHTKKFVEPETIEMEEPSSKSSLYRQQCQNSACAASQHVQPSSRQCRHRTPYLRAPQTVQIRLGPCALGMRLHG